MRRPDEQSRREAANGLGAAGGPFALKHLGTLLRDPSAEVALAAARAIGRLTGSGGAPVPGARFDEIDADGKDFTLARELIVALARIPDTGADAVLKRIADRRALIKRGHFAEINDLASQALAQRAKGGPR